MRQTQIGADMKRKAKCLLFGLAGLAVASVVGINEAAADKIKHSIAVFSGLDKITGRIISFEVGTDETVQFGSLRITERVCYTRPPTEAPQTDTFVEVDEVNVDKTTKRIFTGWMFAASPGLHALDHPVYDIWLTDCKGSEQVIATPPQNAQAPAPAETSATQETAPQLEIGQPDNADTLSPNAQPITPSLEQNPGAQSSAPPSSSPPSSGPSPESSPGAPNSAPAANGQNPPQQSGPIVVGPPPGFVPPGAQPAPSSDHFTPDSQNPGGF